MNSVKIVGLILCGMFLLIMLTCALGHHEIAKQDAATTTQVQQVLAHAASLTTEQALVEGGEKDATPGWQLTSALYNKKSSEVCYTYSGSGHGIKYEKADMESRTWIVYHSDGLKEFSNGRTDYWEAGDDPCERMKSMVKLLGKKDKIVDLMLTPAQNACMDKVPEVNGSEKRLAAVIKATNACFGQTIVPDTASAPSPKPDPAEKEAQCERDYNAHPWYVVAEDGTKSVDVHAACAPQANHQHAKKAVQNNCPLEPRDGYHCNGTTEVALPYTQAAQGK
jgi:hypothetical protein